MSGETIEKLQARYAKFNEQQIRVKTQLEGAQKRLAELQAQATQELSLIHISEPTRPY